MRVLLGAKASHLREIRLPCFASPKVDGWRAVWQGLEFFTRKGLTLPNRVLRAYASSFGVPPGYDGEIIVGDPCDPKVFSKTDSFCKKHHAPIPAEGVRYFVFDNAGAPGGFLERNETIEEAPPFVVKLPQVLICNYDELEAYEAECVAQGYEGICTRATYGRYKQGRSTMKEQFLVKVKRYLDEEVEIIGFKELEHNANPAIVDATGHAKRSSHQDGKVLGGVLGSVIVRWHGAPLHVGTGFDWKDRVEIWNRRGDFLGKLVTIRYSPPTKDLPRQPVWKGLRND